MLLTKLIVGAYRILFELLAIALLIIGPSVIFIGAGVQGMAPFELSLVLVVYLVLVVILLGALAMQLDNNRLLREIAGGVQANETTPAPGSSSSDQNPTRREPPFSR
jgi:hypothetical protein